MCSYYAGGILKRPLLDFVPPFFSIEINDFNNNNNNNNNNNSGLSSPPDFANAFKEVYENIFRAGFTSSDDIQRFRIELNQ